MGKQNSYLARQKAWDRVLQDTTRQTFQQYMTDTLILTLNDSDVMGKEVFGYARLKKVLDAWGKYYDHYFAALTNAPDADYTREKMDQEMRRIIGDSGDFIPFEQRYDWLPEIKYEPKKR